MFETYLNLGLDHILDLNAYDHILFIITLCATYAVRDWRKVLVLVTAFTIGHSITLALSALDVITFPSQLIEILIPITIIITAILNFFGKRDETSDYPKWNYFLPLIFGLIHGMGFSNYLKALLGSSSEVVEPLLYFNLGIEIGQIFIIAAAMLISFFLDSVLKVKHKTWVFVLSSISIVVSLHLLYNLFNA